MLELVVNDVAVILLVLLLRYAKGHSLNGLFRNDYLYDLVQQRAFVWWRDY